MKKDLKHFLALGDIAGRYEEMVQLISELKKTLCLPDDVHIVALGDPNDRGRDSRKVIEYFMEDQVNRTLIQSNHAHMMIDFWENNGVYDDYIFLGNGGVETARSYSVTIPDGFENNLALIWSGCYNEKVMAEAVSQVEDIRIDFIAKVPKEHIDFLKSSPLTLETDEVIMSHAPINPTLKTPTDDTDLSSKWSPAVEFIWNRGSARRRDKFQIHGHMAFKTPQELKDKKGIWGLNMDSSRGDMLSAVHWPSKNILSVPYIK